MKKCAFNCPKSIYLSEKIRKFGHFKRKSDSKKIQRYFCAHCKSSFSSATTSDLCGQNKRRLNNPVYQLLSSGVSQRRAAGLLNIHCKTVVRKFRFMSLKLGNTDNLSKINLAINDVREIQFDHMETFEHTKLKPISILVVVEKTSRSILASVACPSPAKGLLVEKSLKKYGRRKDERTAVMKDTFKKLRHKYPNIEKIESDKSPLYMNVIKNIFPKANYKQFKGRRGCVTGQGELKAGGRDPLFALNHTCAMFRANMNRLFRRTWCTTKKNEELQRHLNLYSCYHNTKLVN